jgi:hypothetical protein
VLLCQRVVRARQDQLAGLRAEVPRTSAVDLAQLPGEVDEERQLPIGLRRLQGHLDLSQFGGGRKLTDRHKSHSGLHRVTSVRARRT